jgi:hypothetical protein
MFLQNSEKIIFKQKWCMKRSEKKAERSEKERKFD